MYILAVIAILQGIVTLLDGLRAARHMRTYRPAGGNLNDRVVVFCPCKGTDPEFDKNIQSILNQDYPNYTAQFIVESEDDPAHAVLRQLSANVLVAGKTLDRGQKVHNLATAVAQRPDVVSLFAEPRQYDRPGLRAGAVEPEAAAAGDGGGRSLRGIPVPGVGRHGGLSENRKKCFVLD